MDIPQDRVLELVRELSNKNEDVRWAAACALAKVGEPAVGPLIVALDDRDSVVRLRAAWALGQIGNMRPVDRLIATLRDGDWSVRLRAYRSRDALLLALRDENTDVRRHVVRALIRIADPGSADRLGDVLKDPDWRVRMGAALALSAIGDAKSREYLVAAARDKNEYVRKIAEAFMKKKG